MFNSVVTLPHCKEHIDQQITLKIPADSAAKSIEVVTHSHIPLRVRDDSVYYAMLDQIVSGQKWMQRGKDWVFVNKHCIEGWRSGAIEGGLYFSPSSFHLQPLDFTLLLDMVWADGRGLL